ncbi:MAG: hypothetical protein U9N07_09110 [Euryarchaeota archaeon]|nr:hypothetical protein [Euryarchaeota archaeon]
MITKSVTRRCALNLNRLAMVVIILCILAAPVHAIDFNIPESTVTEVATNPEYYDGTFTRGTIAIAGTLTNLSDGARISDETSSIAVDTKQISLFDGFGDGDDVKMIGVFNYKHIGENLFVPECILHWPLIDSGTVLVSELVDHPSSYNGKKVTIIGNLSDIRESGMGYMIGIEDDGKYADVRFYGRTVLDVGTEVEVTGIFSTGTLYAETLTKHRTLPFDVPGFSGLMLVSVLVFVFVRRRR